MSMTKTTTASRCLTGIAIFIAVVAASAIGGCGYSTASLHPTEVETIYIPLATSQEFRRGLAEEFHPELVRMIMERTPYRLVDRDKADTILVTRIMDLGESVLTQDQRNAAMDIQVRLSVEYQWKNQRTGQVLASGAPNYHWFYAVAEGQTLRFAQTTAMRKLAEKIVEEMEAEW